MYVNITLYLDLIWQLTCSDCCVRMRQPLLVDFILTCAVVMLLMHAALQLVDYVMPYPFLLHTTHCFTFHVHKFYGKQPENVYLWWRRVHQSRTKWERGQRFVTKFFVGRGLECSYVTRKFNENKYSPKIAFKSVMKMCIRREGVEIEKNLRDLIYERVLTLFR